MSDALKSRLSAERLFTVDDMVEAYRKGYGSGVLDDYGGFDDIEVFEAETLARVQAHLSSDTTTIRPKRV
jgi:hypothetical protein